MAKLEEFKMCAPLKSCPECGATGEYSLLVERAHKVAKAWRDCSGYPDTSRERERLELAISEMIEAINKQRVRR